jgi:glycosyltransferase involved in cell wall biosynthesis
LKIIQVCPIFHSKMVSGVGSHVLNLSKCLAKKGHHVEVFSSDLFKEGSKEKVPKFNVVEGIITHRFKVYKIPSVYSGYLPSHSLIQSLLSTDADVIHAHSYVYFPTYVSAITKKLMNTVLVLTTHQPPVEYASRNRNLMTLYNNSVGRFAIKTADGVIAVTRSEKNFLQAHVRASPSKIKVIPEGVDLQQFYPEGKKMEKRVIILFVGRFSKEKGLRYLIEAIPKVIAEYPQAQFMLVGEDCGVKNELLKLVDELEVKNQIMFLEPRFGSELARIYRFSTLFVLPSLYETFGLVILEAMASGLPVVATKVGGVETLVKHGYNGLFVSPKNPSALSDSIITLLSENSLYKRIRKQCIETSKLYSWSTMAEKVEEFYKSLLN